MKLLYVMSSLPFGPKEAFAIPEFRELVRLGHEVLVIPGDQSQEVTHEDAAFLLPFVQRLPDTRSGRVICAARYFMRSPVKRIRVLRHLVSSTSISRLRKNASATLSGLCVAEIAEAWGAEHIHGYWASYPATTALIAGEASGIPWSFCAHRADILQNNLLSAKMRSCQFARLISKDGIELMQSLGVPKLAEKAHVLRLGVDVPESTAHASPTKGDPFTILFPGWLIPRKGQQYMVEAMALLRDRGLELNLEFAGQGQQWEELHDQVEQLGIGDRVQFLGQVPHQELLRRYESGGVQIVVLSSLHEGVPVSLIEAMAYGVPVVGTAVGGTPELLREGAGQLVTPGDPHELADAIELLVLNPDLREEQARIGRMRVVEEYAAQSAVERLLNLFRG